jgi:hypothetical protein
MMTCARRAEPSDVNTAPLARVCERQAASSKVSFAPGCASCRASAHAHAVRGRRRGQPRTHRGASHDEVALAEVVEHAIDHTVHGGLSDLREAWWGRGRAAIWLARWRCLVGGQLVAGLCAHRGVKTARARRRTYVEEPRGAARRARGCRAAWPAAPARRDGGGPPSHVPSPCYGWMADGGGHTRACNFPFAMSWALDLCKGRDEMRKDGQNRPNRPANEA